ncbi:Copper homeostasis protein CutC [Paraliobacillus sp. PM-2]|uniref:copper homeostasis protein CutC n=1 Tax=Paraliobacillus sp. PM-2 TaxID=1462524 RepID=UPI00061C64B9|nr:copper homeostasis protein CutC [Paraliobacillus sp. PM-2]CQR48284.1 Copper homeostasis protein CutC [Paraliobacillus sp. PM-2]
MKIEVIVQNAEDAKEAEVMGADRLELVSAISEGGLTPSYGTIKQVLQSVNIPVQVMIRPHSNHFYYNESDLAIILEDIKNVITLGGNRIVFGALNRDNTVNQQALNKIVEIAPQLDITFHRAFDEVVSQQDAYHTLTQYKQVKRILTSGGAINCEQGKEELRQLVTLANQLKGPAILPGSGLDSMNISTLHSYIGATQYHFGKAVRNQGSFAEGFNHDVFTNIKHILKS